MLSIPVVHILDSIDCMKNMKKGNLHYWPKVLEHPTFSRYLLEYKLFNSNE